MPAASAREALLRRGLTATRRTASWSATRSVLSRAVAASGADAAFAPDRRAADRRRCRPALAVLARRGCSPASGRAALGPGRCALRRRGRRLHRHRGPAAMAGEAAAMVTAPLHKEALPAATGIHQPGHTEMLQALATPSGGARAAGAHDAGQRRAARGAGQHPRGAAPPLFDLVSVRVGAGDDPHRPRVGRGLGPAAAAHRGGRAQSARRRADTCVRLARAGSHARVNHRPIRRPYAASRSARISAARSASSRSPG